MTLSLSLNTLSSVIADWAYCRPMHNVAILMDTISAKMCVKYAMLHYGFLFLDSWSKCTLSMLDLFRHHPWDCMCKYCVRNRIRNVKNVKINSPDVSNTTCVETPLRICYTA